jgi:catechol 2,3-dioxygenase-like lactoylglutathione lyase family enzyme
MPITTGFNHIATLTPDLDRFVDWYGTVFGATVVHEIPERDDHPRMIILDLGGGGALNVFEVDGRDDIVGEQRTMGGRGAIDHFGIAVADKATLEEVKGRLVDIGADIGEIQQLGDDWSLFFRDVDGMELEVVAKAE